MSDYSLDLLSVVNGVGQGYIKTVRYVFYVNAPTPDKLVLINSAVNRIQNGRKQQPRKLVLQTTSQHSSHLSTIFSYQTWVEIFPNNLTLWHYPLIYNYLTTIYFFFGKLAISNYFTNSVTFARLIIEQLDIFISGIHSHIETFWLTLSKPVQLNKSFHEL